MISMNQEVGVTFTLFDVIAIGTEAGRARSLRFIQSEIQSVQTVQASRLSGCEDLLNRKGRMCAPALNLHPLSTYFPPSK